MAKELEQTGKVLPEGWKWVLLGEVCDFNYGKSLSFHARQGGEVPVYGSNGIIGYHNESLTTKSTIIIGRKGSIGEIHLSHTPCFPIDTTYYIEQTKLNTNLEWLTYCLKALKLYELNKAAAIPGLNREDAYKNYIPLPPLEEQKRIVAILNEKMAAIENARAATLAQIEAAKALPAAYLRQVFNSPEAQTWERKKLGDICDLVGGMQPPKSTFKYKPEPGYVQLVQIQDFRKSDVAVYIPAKEAKRFFDETDVMIGRYGPPVFQILRGLSGAYNVAIMKTVPKDNLLKDYLYYLLQEPTIQNAVISQSQRSAGQSGVQKEFLEKFPVMFPPVDEQQKIATFLKEKFITIQNLKTSLQEQLETINTLPAAILKQAFNGEL